MLLQSDASHWSSLSQHITLVCVNRITEEIGFYSIRRPLGDKQ